MFSFHAFGGAYLADESGPVSGPATQRLRLAVLAMLALAPAGGISRDKLIAYVWPELDVEAGRSRLADALHGLRRTVGKDAIISAGDDLRLNAERVRTDAGEFEQLLERGDWQRAVALYAGPFLDGFFIPEAPGFENWVEEERVRLARAYARALEMLAEEYEVAGDLGAAVDCWRRLAAHDPYSSRVALRLMQALAAAGDPAGALQHRRVHEMLLREQLGTEPSAEVAELAERIRAGQLGGRVERKGRSEGSQRSAELAGVVGDRGAPHGAVPNTESTSADAELPAPLPGDGSRTWRFRRFKRAEWAVPIAASGGLLVLLAASGLYLRERQPPPLDSTGLGVVVLPFGNGSGAGSAAHTEMASLERLFLASLEAVPPVRAVDGSALLRAGGGWRATAFPDLLAGARDRRARYLVTADALAGSSPRFLLDLYAVESGERVLRSVGGSANESLEEAVERIALEVLLAIAHREPLDLLRIGLLGPATTSVTALQNLLHGQDRFFNGDTDGAVAAFRRAIAADSSFGLAYHRLSMAETWEPRWDYAAALRAVEAGLARAAEMSPIWLALLNAQRHYVLRHADSAIASFGRVAAMHPQLVDGWYGLAESIFHYGAFADNPPTDALGAFERLLARDSAFARVEFHLVQLALIAGDAARARRYLDRISASDPHRETYELGVALRFGDRAESEAARRRLPTADRASISRLVPLFTRGGLALELADTLTTALIAPGRSADDRLRGGQYRLLILAALGRWDAGVAAWRAAGGGDRFDPWMVHAQLAGFPADSLALPMFGWADSLVAEGRSPHFRSPFDEAENAFRALVHQATLAGDSARVTYLLERLEAAGPLDPLDPLPGSLRASLDARLALLAGDSARAMHYLRLSVSRPLAITWYQPLTDMATQRRLLADLARARGDLAQAELWERSFAENWAFGDLLFLRHHTQPGSRSPPGAGAPRPQ